MPLSFFNQRAEVLRAPTVDKRGSPVRDWGRAESHVIDRCLVTASSTSRDFDGRVTQAADRRTLRCPYDADVQAGDRVLFEGAVYEVDGEVFRTPSPTGRVSSTRCELVRWEG